MKASELRIGNWVFGDHQWEGKDGPFQVNSLQGNDDYGDFVQGIPINEEWLTKFGFVIDSDGWHVKDGCFGIIKREDGWEVYMDCARPIKLRSSTSESLSGPHI